MRALIEGNETYQAVTVMRVDWDQFGDAPITDELNVRRRSVLIMFKDGEEIDRVNSATSADAIEPMFQKAVAS